ncbi:MAG TPA: hypothetical protein PLV85_24040, partial [Polyangiaceae bacterium]|nr:hypothetical protein [Polyangiaceae bacterium]
YASGMQPSATQSAPSLESLVAFGKTAIPQRPAAISAGCPGSRSMAWNTTPSSVSVPAKAASALTQWPIQLHLLSPGSSFLRARELLLAADCVAFSLGSFHGDLLEGRSLAIACPKLDDPSGYEEKIAEILAHCDVPALRVVIMEVPCCGGLLRLASTAAKRAGYQGEIEVIVVSRFGEILQRKSLTPTPSPNESTGCACGG